MKISFCTKSKVFQFIVSICAYLPLLDNAIVTAWFSTFSSNISELSAEDIDVTLTESMSQSQVSLIGSIMYLAVFPGSLTFGKLADRFGRKKSLYFCTMIHILSFILMIFEQNFLTLLIARILSGIAMGGALSVSPIFVTEIAEKKIRGFLCGMLDVIMQIGFLLGYVICSSVNFRTIPMIFIAMNLIFFLGFPFLHETPQYLLLQGRENDAEKSLKFFRGLSKNAEITQVVQDEIRELKNSPTLTNQTSNITWNDFKPSTTRKALLICTVLYLGKVLTGNSVIVIFKQDVIVKIGTKVDASMAATVATLVCLPYIFTCPLFVELWGRKPIIVVSSIVNAAALIPTALFARYHDIWDVNDAWRFTFLIPIFASSTGLLSLPLQLSAEVLPPKLRSRICSVSLTTSYLGIFLMVNFFLSLVDSLGLDTLLYFFSAWCIFEGVFVWKFLPETKGKSYDEIVKCL